ncbi:MAG: CoA-binding protein [Ignavibacteria bacterium]|nr:CoA-binding protein [Ignavibacteria bacterium]
MEQIVADFIKSKRIAIVGYSSNKNKFGNAVYRELKSRGYEVYPVNKNKIEADGEKCFPDLLPLKDKIDAVFISTKSSSVKDVLKQASDLSIKNIWLQQGAETKEILEEAKKMDIEMVTGKCILMYLEPVNSIHKFHRTINKIFGRY